MPLCPWRWVTVPFDISQVQTEIQHAIHRIMAEKVERCRTFHLLAYPAQESQVHILIIKFKRLWNAVFKNENVHNFWIDVFYLFWVQVWILSVFGIFIYIFFLRGDRVKLSWKDFFQHQHLWPLSKYTFHQRILSSKIFRKSCSFQASLGENPIWSKFWAQGPSFGSKLRWGPPDQNPGSATAFSSGAERDKGTQMTCVLFARRKCGSKSWNCRRKYVKVTPPITRVRRQVTNQLALFCCHRKKFRGVFFFAFCPTHHWQVTSKFSD